MIASEVERAEAYSTLRVTATGRVAMNQRLELISRALRESL